MQENKHEYMIPSQTKFVPNHLKHLCMSFTSCHILNEMKMLSEKRTLSSIAIDHINVKGDQGLHILNQRFPYVKWEISKISMKTRTKDQHEHQHHSETIYSL